jgi:hypothetical protein
MDNMQNERAMGRLKEYVYFLNYGGVAAKDFRKLTELAAQLATQPLRDKALKAYRHKSGAMAYRHTAVMAFIRKTGPLLRRIARKYPSYDHLMVAGPRAGGALSCHTVPFRSVRDSEFYASYAKADFRDIVNAGLLSRIGRCKLESCRLFFHGRIGKRFCSDKCARRQMRQTPQFKERNRKDQRKHYDKYFRAKSVARGPRSKRTRTRKSG